MATINQHGFNKDTLQQIITNLKNEFYNIYGADVVLSDTDPDSQMINVFANAIDDIEGLIQDWCNAWDIDKSTGNVLSSLVSYRRTKRKDITKSSVDLTITSVSPSMPFPAGLIFSDANSSQYWTIPTSFSTDATNSVVVTAYADDYGQIEASANTINTIITPTFGFATVNNINPAVVGDDEEGDYALKIRSKSTMSDGAINTVDGLRSALANLDGVQGLPYVYENVQNTTQTIGGGYDLLAHSIGIVVYGGTIADIAQTVYDYKSAGCDTGIYQTGTLEPNNISTTYTNANGSIMYINFSRPQVTGLDVQIELPIGTVLDTALQNSILSAVSDFADNTAIGTTVSHIDVITSIYDNVNYFYAKEVRVKNTAGVFGSTATPSSIGKFIGTLSTVTYLYT